MKFYRCRVHGQNFPGVILKKTRPIGFYTTRFVEAVDSAAAERAVRDLLRNDEDLHVAPKHQTPDAKVYFDEICEVSSIIGPNKGFTFYSD